MYNNSVLKYIKYELYDRSLLSKYMKYVLYNESLSLKHNKYELYYQPTLLKLNINQLYERFYIHKIKEISFEYVYILDEYENIVKLETHINYYRSDVLKHIPSFVNNINLYELNEKMLKL